MSDRGATGGLVIVLETVEQSPDEVVDRLRSSIDIAADSSVLDQLHSGLATAESALVAYIPDSTDADQLPDPLLAIDDTATAIAAVVRSLASDRTPIADGLEVVRLPDDDPVAVSVPSLIDGGSSPSTRLDQVTDTIEQLRTFATTLGDVTDELGIFETAVEAAEEILDFDGSAIATKEGDVLIHRAKSGDFTKWPDRSTVEFLTSGDRTAPALEALANERTVVEDDLGDWTDYHSTLTVPIADASVFQAISEEPAAFSSHEIAMAEILASFTTQAVRRVRSAREVRTERDTFAALFENIPDPVIELAETDDDLVISNANPSFYDQFDHDCEAFVDEPVESVLTATPEVATVFESRGDTEIVVDTPAGSRTFLARSVPIASTDTSRRFLILTDITERRMLTETLRTRTDKIQQLHHLATELASCDEREEIYRLTVAALEEILAFDACTIDTVENGQLVMQATGSGIADEEAHATVSVDDEESIAAETLRSGESMIIDDTEDTKGLETPYRSILSIPIGEVGVLQVGNRDPNAFDQDDLELVELLVAHVREALKWRHSDEAMRTERDKFASLFENIVDPVVEAEFSDGNSVIRDVNPAFVEVFGFDSDTVRGKTLNELVVPAGASEESAAISAKIAEGEPVELEVTRTTADGEDREFLLRTVPFDLAASPVSHYLIYTEITEQKRLEQELRDRNEKIHGLLELATDLSGITDEETLYTEAIEAAESILDFDVCALDIIRGRYLEKVATGSGVVSGATIDRIDLDETTPEESLAVRSLEAGETALQVDATEEPYGSIMSAPIDGIGVFQVAHEEAVGFDEADIELMELFVSHLAEVIKRVRSEHALRDERDKFATLFEHVHDPVVEAVYDGDTPIVEAVNGAFEDVFGYDADTVTGDPVDEYIVPEEYLDEGSEFNERAAAGEAVEAEVQRETVDGIRDFLLRIVPYRTEDPVAVYGIYVDITEQSDRVRKLERLTDATRHQLEAADVDEIFATVRSAVDDVIDHAEVTHFHDTDDGLAIDDSTVLDVSRLQACLAEGAIEEVTAPTTDRSVSDVPGCCLIVPINDTTGMVLTSETAFTAFEKTLASILAAVTESAIRRTEREQALRDRERELASKNERLDQFASIVSHDLRNPLNVAAGHLKLYRDTGEEEHLEAVERGHDRIARIVDDVLALARQGEGGLDITPVDPAHVVEEAWLTIDEEAAQLTVQVDDERPIRADRSRLKQVFENLFRNAIDHGGDDVEVIVEIDTGTIAVEDSGPGIVEDERERIFETGYSGGGGTGLGLSIVNEIVNTHDWSIAATDPYHAGGARFELSSIEHVESEE